VDDPVRLPVVVAQLDLGGHAVARRCEDAQADSLGPGPSMHLVDGGGRVGSAHEQDV